jgi:UDP-N-acetylglucosamine 1-carboxyvinyltransferase
VENEALIIDTSTVDSTEIPEELASEMRSSIIFMGPVLAKYGKVTISYPGGYVIFLAQTFRKLSI